jgi:hypothetical protein
METADFLEKVSGRKWVVAEHNPRQNAIASLRCEIRQRTKKPHDRELADLLDAAFRAAGFREGSHNRKRDAKSSKAKAAKVIALLKEEILQKIDFSIPLAITNHN